MQADTDNNQFELSTRKPGNKKINLSRTHAGPVPIKKKWMPQTSISFILYVFKFNIRGN